jgi:hypothetical protein
MGSQNDAPLLLDPDSEESDDEVVLDEGFLLKATSIRRRQAAQAAVAAAAEVLSEAEAGHAERALVPKALVKFWRRFPAKQVLLCLYLFG